MTLHRWRTDGGASAAEVALLIAVIAVVAAAALSRLGSSGEGSLHAAGKGIHEAAPGGSTDGGGSGGSGGSPGSDGSGGSGGSTPTTAPTPSTTSAPTTTTGMPATTSPPATTTTAAPQPATASLGNGQSERRGYSQWEASADLVLVADGGAALGGTATVRVRTQKANGQWTTQTIQVPVAADGTATIESGPHQRTGGSRITKVEYTVVSVDLDGGGAWDQSQSSLTIAAPA